MVKKSTPWVGIVLWPTLNYNLCLLSASPPWRRPSAYISFFFSKICFYFSFMLWVLAFSRFYSYFSKVSINLSCPRIIFSVFFFSFSIFILISKYLCLTVYVHSFIQPYPLHWIIYHPSSSWFLQICVGCINSIGIVVYIFWIF